MPCSTASAGYSSKDAATFPQHFVAKREPLVLQGSSGAQFVRGGNMRAHQRERPTSNKFTIRSSSGDRSRPALSMTGMAERLARDEGPHSLPTNARSPNASILDEGQGRQSSRPTDSILDELPVWHSMNHQQERLAVKQVRPLSAEACLDFMRSRESSMHTYPRTGEGLSDAQQCSVHQGQENTIGVDLACEDPESIAESIAEVDEVELAPISSSSRLDPELRVEIPPGFGRLSEQIDQFEHVQALSEQLEQASSEALSYKTMLEISQADHEVMHSRYGKLERLVQVHKNEDRNLRLQLKTLQNCLDELSQDKQDLAAALQQVTEAKEGLCVICLSGARSFAAIPCGHLSFCEGCAAQQHLLCPVCRQNVSSLVRVFMP